MKVINLILNGKELSNNIKTNLTKNVIKISMDGKVAVRIIYGLNAFGGQ